MIQIPLNLLTIAYVAANLIGILLMYTDKKHAKFGIRRVSKRVLMTAGALGGAPGMWMAMYVLRHKTHHREYKIAFPLMFLVHILIFVWMRYSNYVVLLLDAVEE